MTYGLVVEDLECSACWLSRALAVAFPEIGVRVAGTLAEAHRRLDEFAPDIALVDLDLPDGSGVELIARIGHEFPGCAAVVTTIFADDAHLFPALRAGAAGYLLKDQPIERVIAQLQAIHRGEPPLSPAVAQRLLKVFAPDTGDVDGAHLTPRERETLVLIAKGYRLPEVASILGVTRNTAAGLIKAIYRKLQIGSRAEATLQAVRMGLINVEL